jgi:hypothetical protein
MKRCRWKPQQKALIVLEGLKRGPEPCVDLPGQSGEQPVLNEISGPCEHRRPAGVSTSLRGAVTPMGQKLKFSAMCGTAQTLDCAQPIPVRGGRSIISATRVSQSFSW